MASEDSNQVCPGLAAIHRLRDFSDLDQPIGLEMPAGVDDRDAVRELLEVLLLRGVHRMLPEERNDRPEELAALAHHVAEQVLAVVVVSPVGDYLSHPEELLEFMKTRDALGALCHRELMSHLIAGPVAGSIPPGRLPNETD